MKYLKLFEWQEGQLDFLIDEIFNAIKETMDNKFNAYCEWRVEYSNHSDDEYQFNIVIEDPYQEHEGPLDDDGIFYNQITVNFYKLEDYIENNILPLIEDIEYFDKVTEFDCTYTDGIYYVRCDLSNSLLRGKKANLWELK